MQFLVCLAALIAAASAGLTSVTYHGNAYNHGYGLGYGYGAGYGHGLAYAHAPVVKAIAPLATSYANVNSVHYGQHAVVRPVHHGGYYAAAAPVAYGHGLGYGYGHGYARSAYGLGYGHGYGYNNYHY